MASSSSLAFLALAITTTLVASKTLALPPNKPSSVISAAPAPTALFPNPPLSSSYLQLPPDVAPLLPFSGGGAHSPAGSFIPTIPSSRSPPNPDITGSTGLDTAFGPSGPLQDSSARVILVKGFRNGTVFSWLLAFWLVVMVFIV